MSKKRTEQHRSKAAQAATWRSQKVEPLLPALATTKGVKQLAVEFQVVAGTALFTLRKECKVEQKDVARACRVTQGQWSRIEQGKSVLTINQFELAARALKMGLVEVMAEMAYLLDKARDQNVLVYNDPASRRMTINATFLSRAAFLSILKGAS